MEYMDVCLNIWGTPVFVGYVAREAVEVLQQATYPHVPPGVPVLQAEPQPQVWLWIRQLEVPIDLILDPPQSPPGMGDVLGQRVRGTGSPWNVRAFLWLQAQMLKLSSDKFPMKHTIRKHLELTSYSPSTKP